MQHFRRMAFALLLLLLPLVWFTVLNREMNLSILLISPDVTPKRLPSTENPTLVNKIQRTVKDKNKGCSLDREYQCYAQCCEDHWIYSRYFANPPLCNGTYVEIGAYDGVGMSNTKFFEDALGWSGVLIEGHPALFNKLVRNRPKSIKKHSAICKEGVKKVNFTASDKRVTADVAHLTSTLVKVNKIDANNTIEVPCQPMGKLLREAGVSSIDFFSLDVEGAEMLVLETMDWKIPVKVFLVETQWIDKKAVTEYFKGKGYKALNRLGGCKVNTVFERVEL